VLSSAKVLFKVEEAIFDDKQDQPYFVRDDIQQNGLSIGNCPENIVVLFDADFANVK